MLCDVTTIIDSRHGDDFECELNFLREEPSFTATAVSPSEAGLAGNVNATFFGASEGCWVQTSLSSPEDKPTTVTGRLLQSCILCLWSGQANDSVQKLFPLALCSG